MSFFLSFFCGRILKNSSAVCWIQFTKSSNFQWCRMLAWQRRNQVLTLVRRPSVAAMCRMMSLPIVREACRRVMLSRQTPVLVHGRGMQRWQIDADVATLSSCIAESRETPPPHRLPGLSLPPLLTVAGTHNRPRRQCLHGISAKLPIVLQQAVKMPRNVGTH